MNKLLGVLYEAKIPLIVAGAVCIVVIAVYLFRPIPDNRNRINEIGADIQAAREQQSKAARRLETVETGLADSARTVEAVTARITTTEGTIKQAEKRIDHSQAVATDSAGLIAEGRNILEQIRRRGQSKT